MNATVITATLAIAALASAACGSTPATSPTPTPPVGPTSAPTALPTAQPTATPEPAASLEPGDMQFRVVNAYHDSSGAPTAVDVYVRTEGRVQAAPAALGVAFGTATDWFAPPDPGSVVVTPAGAGDATCVGDCPHIVSSASTMWGEGDKRTLIVYDEGTLDLWHNPDPDTVGTIGNALVPADPSTALAYVVGIGLHNARFGLHLGFAGVAGCQENRTSASIMVGGNQVAVFGFDGSADVLLYDSADFDCALDIVGGPFAVSGSAGSRTMLVLFGEPGDMDGLTLEI